MNWEGLQAIALGVAEARSLDQALTGIVQGLARDPSTALVRIWLQKPGDCCDVCPLRDECPKNVDCLHLVASAGQSLADPSVTWEGLDGRFSRFPLNSRKVGQVGGSGKPQLLRFDSSDVTWSVD
ncbi:MAG: hypothetical protein ACI8X5_004146, partial [Planctomycetota bacterium]